MRSPASGVLSWCAASARKRFCVPIESLQLAQQVVDRRHQRRHLQRHQRFVERAQVAGPALADALLQHRQRLDAAHQRQPDQQHRQRQDRELRQHHALDDLGGQHRLLLARLGHLHQRRRRRRASRPAIHSVGDAHRLAVHLVVAQVDHARRGRARRCRAPAGRARREQFAVAVQHLVVDVVGIVGAQDLARRAAAARSGSRSVLPRRPACASALHVVLERAVEGRVGDALRHQPGHADAHRPQQQQRREHPVEDLAEEGALRALEELHRALCGRRHQGIFSRQ